MRHGEKTFNNGCSTTEPIHDPGLTEEGIKNIDLIVQQYSKIAIPTIIYSSTFLRARETAEKLKESFERIANQRIASDEEGSITSIRIVYDSNLGEYLGNRKGRDEGIDVYDETKSYGPLPGLDEEIKDLRKRCTKLKKEYIIKEREENICIVTHGIVMRFICESAKIPIKKYNYLEGFIISKDHRTWYIKEKRKKIVRD